MKSRFSMHLLVFLILSFSVPSIVGAQTEQLIENKVGSDVLRALEQDGIANVVIALRPTPVMNAAFSNPEQIRNENATLQASVLSTINDTGYQNRLQYQAVPALAGVIYSSDALLNLTRNSDVMRIDLDVGGQGGLSQAVPLVEADIWQSNGITGEGVVVAVLDSGIDTDHDDLGDDLIHEACFLNTFGAIDGIGSCPNGSDRQFGQGSAEDDQGHGTLVSGIITSAGIQSPIGVAPDAEIVSIKVLDSNNSFYFFSEIVAALDYIINNRPDVDVINMSLQTSATFSGDCDNATSWTIAGAAAVNTLRANGVITFAVSGNYASGTQMSAPGCLSNTISVGATNDSDVVATFTNSNASLDIMAPGVNITSAGLFNGSSTGSGTSFASPIAAGCAALLIEANVATTPAEIEAYLESSAVTVTDSTNNLSFPRIDCFIPERGDCNVDMTVDAGDLSAIQLEIFTAYIGEPIGCDANADTVIDAGDLACAQRIIFDEDYVCGVSP